MSINLGSVGSAFVDIQVDLSNLQAELSSAVQSAGKAGKEVGDKFGRGIDEGLAPVAGSIHGLGPLFDGVGQHAGTVAQQIGFDFSAAESVVVTSSESMAKSVVASSATMGGAVEQTGGYIQNLKQSFANFGDALTPALERLDSLRPMLTSIGTQAQGLGTMLSIGVTAPIVALGAASIHAFADIDSLKRGMTAVAGSAEEAKKQFADMQEVAKLPGLGLEEAVQGSIRLQSFGFSATQSKEALLAFGNAIATVGGGKGELDGVIRQLGQMAGASKVLTQDLRPIIQQVPQVAGILKAAFGPDVLSDPAKRLEQLGVSTQQFIQTMITGLAKLPPVTGGIKNDLENFGDSATIELSRVGEALAPMVHDFVELAVPAIHAMVDAFVALPGPARDAVIGIAGVAAVAGPALIVFGSMAKGLSDIIGIAKTFNEMRVASDAITTVETASTEANTAMRTAAEAEVLLGDGGKAAAVGLGLMSDAELIAAREAIALDSALGKTALLGTLTSFGEALVILAGAAAGGGVLAWLVSLLDPLKQVHREMDGATVATHQLVAGSGLMGDAFDRLVTSVQKMADGHRALSVSAQQLIDKQKGLQQEYDLSKRTYDELVQAQKDGVDVGNALALAHDKMTKAFKELNPQIAENEKATKAATAARAKDTEEAKKQDAEALRQFEEAKKRETELVALQKSGVDVTKSLKAAKDELSAAFLNLNRTVEENARQQMEANAGTREASIVSATQRDALFKVSEAAREYVKTMQDAATAALNHEIATNRVVGVLKDGVTYIHSFSDAQVEAAKTGSLTWKQIQDAVGGVVSTIKMVPQVVDAVAVSIDDLAHGATATMGDLSGSVISYEGQLTQATGRVTDHLEAVRILRGEGVQHIETLADAIGKMGKQWVTATEAIYGNKAAIPDWVKANTIAIVNGVRVVSDAAAAAHASTDGLKASMDGVSKSMEDVGSHAGSAVAGINKVAEAARNASSAGSTYLKNRDGMEGVSTLEDRGGGDMSFEPSGYLPEGQKPSQGFGIGNFQPDPTRANAGDIRSIHNIFTETGGMVINVQTWAQNQLDGIRALMEVGKTQAEAEMLAESGLGVVKAQYIKKLQDEAIAQQQAAAAAVAATKAIQTQADQAKNADAAQKQAALSVSDLTDQLWHLIDAGQSNGQAAYELRQRISELGGAATTTSNAFTDTITKAASFSAALGDLAATAVAATQQAVAVTTQARSAGISGDPFAATKPLALPSVPSSTAQLSYTPLTNVGGKLVVVTPPPIVIQQVSPEQTGQEVTDILRRAALQ